MTDRTDRELIQFAAKAAGLHWASWDIVRLRDLGHGIAADMMWNPIKSDADALRLAVKLRLNVSTPTLTLYAYVQSQDMARGVIGKDEDEDPYAATRRAIVLAAAAIGEAMP